MRNSLRISAISAALRSLYRPVYYAFAAVLTTVVLLVALLLIAEFVAERLPGDPFFLNMGKDAAYATLAEAEADGVVDRGWVPEWLPASARDLQESHNLDTNESWLTFLFDAGDADFPNARVERRIRGGGTVTEDVCESVAPGDVELPWPPSKRKRPWWPDALRGWGTPPADYAYYRCTWHRAGEQVLQHYLAVDADARRAWVWANH